MSTLGQPDICHIKKRSQSHASPTARVGVKTVHLDASGYNLK